MSLIENKHKLERLDQLIRLQATGSVQELATKMNTTKRTIFRIIKNLKEIGCPIYFNKSKNSYCYEYQGSLIIKFKAKEINNNELNKIQGKGNCYFLQSDIFCHSIGVSLWSKTKQNLVYRFSNTY